MRNVNLIGQYDAADAATQFNRHSVLHAPAIGNEKAAACCVQGDRRESFAWSVLCLVSPLPRESLADENQAA